MKKQWMVGIWALLLLAAGSARAQPPVEDVASLPAFNVDTRQNSVSGISSGGYMAQQFHTAYAEALIGVGILAAGPYYCAENSVTLALTRCMRPTEADVPDPERLAWLTEEFAAQGRVVDPAEMRDDWVWLFSGSLDTVVQGPVADSLAAYYGHFVDSERLRYVNDLPAAHSMVTDGWGKPCTHEGSSSNPDDHFINDCGYDAAGELLKHVYRRMRRPSEELGGRFIRFPQADFIHAPTSHGMEEHGYAYVPRVCDKGGRCRVHVVFHGCLQSAERIGETFVRHAGYNEWADANRIVLLYPQAKTTTTQGNGNGCWDWWGYDDAGYMWRDGRQMRAVKAMIDHVAGAAEPSTPPPSPTGVSASVSLDATVTLSWESVEDPQVQGYVVYQSDVSAGPFVAAHTGVVTEPRLSLTDLPAGDRHFVIVAVGHQGVESVPTPPVAVTVPGL